VPISAKDDIEYLRNLYKDFCEAVSVKVADFFEGKYDTFEKDKIKDAIMRLGIAKEKYDALKQYYAFIKLIEDIFQLDFIAEMAKISQKYGFKMEKPLVEQYGDSKAFLALELLANYPIVGKETYTNQEFRNIAFTRQMKIPEDTSASVTQVQTVPILKITIDEKNTLQKIEPQPFRAIEAFIPPILRKD